MDNDERNVFRWMSRWFLGIVFGLIVLAALSVLAGRAFDLAWLPFSAEMHTRIVRNSNGYITSQQESLRQFAMDEPFAKGPQRRAIIREMCEIKDRIGASYIAPDIRNLLAGKCI